MKALSFHKRGRWKRRFREKWDLPEVTWWLSSSPKTGRQVFQRSILFFLSCHHSFVVKAQEAGGQAAFRVSFRVAPLQKFLAPSRALFSSLTLRLQRWCPYCIKHRARLQGQPGRGLGRSPPTLTLRDALCRGERRVGAGKAGPGHRVRPW